MKSNIIQLLALNGSISLTETAVIGIATLGSVELIPRLGIVIVTCAVAALIIVYAIQAVGLFINDRLSEEVNARLRQAALTDPLTSLPNRTHLVEQLNKKIAAHEHEQIAVISVDLDHFKTTKDLGGYPIGDEMLKVMASRLAASKANYEFIARTGVKGFTIFRQIKGADDAKALAAWIRECLIAPIMVDGTDEIVVDGHFGVAIYPFHDIQAEGLISKSELAAYNAKFTAADSAVIYEPIMDDAARERRALVSDLRSALSKGQFELHYQSQESLTTNDVVGHEALLRWRHPKRGLVPPSEFIPIAEETKLIIGIGEWVLRQACYDAAAHPELGRVAVNLSPVQFAQPNLLAMINSILSETSLDPARLEIELTESTLMTDAKRNLSILEDIQSLGVSIAMDDFGTGYSSLSTLRSFRFNKIKMDRSFMPEVDSDPQAKAIIRAIFALGQSLGVPVLAEGVETRSQLEFLRKEGCSEAQGFLLGRPEILSRTVRKLPYARPLAAA